MVSSVTMKIDLPQFTNARVAIVGDIMLDCYWQGKSSRISPEAPVPVLNIDQEQSFPGGAGNVALNLRSLGAEVNLLSCVGKDSAAKTLEQLLKKASVVTHLQAFSDATTSVKTRAIARNQQLLRIDNESGFHHVQHSLLMAFKKILSKTDAVILSDYAKGVLLDPQPFILLAKEANIPVLVDPKKADFSAYRGATIVTPNMKEFTSVVGPCESEVEIVEKGTSLLSQHDINALLVTRGEQGMMLLSLHQDPVVLPTHAREVYDVTGAGDTVIATFAAAMACHLDFPAAALLANTAAGVVVSKLGAATVSIPELRRALQRHYDSELGVLSEDQLLVAIEDARAHGEKIVMTNGCFDLLHAGHVAYLEQAKALGDRLIVAVNSDESVSRLKGNARPINTLEHRMAVLSGLRSVDWVVSFSDDNPNRLLKLFKPDVLVKGGDYAPSQVVGAEIVLKQGGEVNVLGLEKGCSTTTMLERIARS